METFCIIFFLLFLVGIIVGQTSNYKEKKDSNDGDGCDLPPFC